MGHRCSAAQEKQESRKRWRLWCSELWLSEDSSFQCVRVAFHGARALTDSPNTRLALHWFKFSKIYGHVMSCSSSPLSRPEPKHPFQPPPNFSLHGITPALGPLHCVTVLLCPSQQVLHALPRG